MEPVYLDHNATTPPSPAVLEAMQHGARDLWANPSSVHRAGQQARAAVELARSQVARLIGGKPRELIFTSSCTEALDLGIRGGLEAAGPSRPVLVTSAVEHAAIRDLTDDLEQRGLGHAIEIRRLPVGAGGRYDVEAAAGLIDQTVGVVAVQWANNETGTLQPIRELGALCAQAGAVLLVDGAQWVGKLPCEVRDESLGIDALTLSAHKFHGPKGVGALWVRRGIRVRPRVRGSQELGRRGGTENVPGILGMGIAAEESVAWLADETARDRVADLRDRLEARLASAIPEAEFTRPSDPKQRLWNTCNVGFPGLESEAILIPLSERGVFASAGAACSSGSLEPSPVLLAMGVEPRVAHGSVRLSLGRTTTEAEVDHAAAELAAVVERVGRVR